MPRYSQHDRIHHPAADPYIGPLAYRESVEAWNARADAWRAAEPEAAAAFDEEVRKIIFRDRKPMVAESTDTEIRRRLLDSYAEIMRPNPTGNSLVMSLDMTNRYQRLADNLIAIGKLYGITSADFAEIEA